MQLDDRFYQRKTEPGPFRAARRIRAVKPVKHARQLFRSDTAAAVSHRHLGAVTLWPNGDNNAATSLCKAKRVVDQVAHRPAEQDLISINFRFAFAADRETPFFGQRFVISSDLFDF